MKIDLVSPDNIEAEVQQSGIKVNFQDKPIKVDVKSPVIFEFSLNVRTTTNGDLMIFDHSDIDIMILSEQKKVVAFAKDLMSEVVYGTEARLFDHLKKKGLVAYDSIQGGNVYGSLEAKLLQSKKFDIIKLTLKNISEWLTSEIPYMDTMEDFEEMENAWLADPNEDHSTEFDARRHAEEKGAIRQHGLFAPYLYGKYSY
jgi:hypothetical protein